MTPMAISMAAYTTSGRWMRSAQRPKTRAPTPSPPMKTANKVAAAQVVLPKIRLRYRSHTT